MSWTYAIQRGMTDNVITVNERYERIYARFMHYLLLKRFTYPFFGHAPSLFFHKSVQSALSDHWFRNGPALPDIPSTPPPFSQEDLQYFKSLQSADRP